MMLPTVCAGVSRGIPYGLQRSAVDAQIAPQQDCPINEQLCRCQQSDKCCALNQQCDCPSGFARCV
jgi:hypothetical protein